MTPIQVSLVTFALVFGGALLGMSVCNALSEGHLRQDVKDVIKLSSGLIGTMAALVLGLLITSAKNTYDTNSTQIKQITANVILLDLDLERYGSDAQSSRIILRRAIPALINQIWTEGYHAKPSAYSATAEGQELVKEIQQLKPDTDSKRSLQARMLTATANLIQSRLSLFTQLNDALPGPLLVTLIFWLTIIFASFGLFVRLNRIALATFVISGLSVASAIFLILEMGHPFKGLMQISGEPLRYALTPLGL